MNRLLAGLAGIAVAGATAAQDPSQIPVSDFTRRADVEFARLSPDGDYIAASRYVNDDKHAVGVTNLNTNALGATLAFGTDESVGNFWWANPKRLLAATARSYGRLDQAYLTGELIGIDADGKNHKYLFGYRGTDTAGTKIQTGVIARRASATLTATLPGDADTVLIHTKEWDSANARRWDDIPARLERLNVKTGRTELLESPNLLDSDTDADDAGRALLSAGREPTGEWVLQARRAPGAGWTRFPVPGGAANRILLEGVSRDGATGYFVTHRVGSPNCLYEYRFADAGVTELKCANFDEVVLSNAERTPIALYFEDGLPRTEYLRPEHPEARRLRAISAALPGQRVRLAGTSADNNRALLHVSADRTPGGYYLLDEKTKNLRFLAPHRRWIDPRLMAPMTPATIKARDGLDVPVFLTAREGLKARKAPMVVLPHGGPHGIRDYWTWDQTGQLLASRGYAVLQVNYRGSGGYGYSFEDAGYGNWGTKIQDDITDATRWAIAQGIADPARICIYGGSFGGYSALMSATREPDLYRCAIGFAGVYDLAAQSADSDIGDSKLGRQYLADAVGSDPNALRDNSPVTHVARIKAALLIAHGTMDKRVPFSQAKRLREALDAAKKPYEWLEYEGEEHGLTPKNEVDFYTRMLAFLDKHIGPGAKPG